MNSVNQTDFLQECRKHRRLTYVFLIFLCLNILNLIADTVILLVKKDVFNLLLALVSWLICYMLSKQSYNCLRYPQPNKLVILNWFFAAMNILRIVLNRQEELSNAIQVVILICLLVANSLLQHRQIKIEEFKKELLRSRKQYRLE